jgi:hypothetical protein
VENDLLQVILEKGWIALALSLVVLVVLWRRYVKLEDSATITITSAHEREVAMAEKSADLTKEILPLIRAVDERGTRIENALVRLNDEIGDLDRFETRQKLTLDEISKIRKAVEG